MTFAAKFEQETLLSAGTRLVASSARNQTRGGGYPLRFRL